MVYEIKKRSYDNAKKLGVIIKQSTNPKKKIDVYDKNEKKIASIGAIGYNDYISYLEIDKELAEKKRQQYMKRHAKDINNKNGGYYSFHILWN